MNRLPKHSDLDANILEPQQFVWRPFFVTLSMGCTGTLALSVILTTGVSVAAGYLLPLWIWLMVPLVLVGIEVSILTFKSRAVWTRYLDLQLQSIEAWLARAGHSVDLNRDGRIGYWQVIEQLDEPQRAIPMTVNGETSLMLAQDTPTIAKEVDAPAAPEPVLQKREILRLPNGKPLPVESVTAFVDGVVDNGISRSYWVDKNKQLERDEYDGLIMLLDQAGLLKGRKKGYAGKLVTRNPARIKAKIGLGSLG